MIPCLFADPGVAPIDWVAACRELSERDRPLGGVIAQVGGTGPVPQPSTGTFESLARSIVYQQLPGKAAGTNFGPFPPHHVAAGSPPHTACTAHHPTPL